VEDPLAHLLEAGLDLSRERRYVVERELGRGSMGVVYAGRDLLLDRPVAIKVMASPMAGDVDLRHYFEREARAAGRLSHRNVVTVHDFGYDARGYPYVVMELLRGRDLRQVAIASVPLALDRRLAVVLQILAGLAHAHSSGVVHRDVKPANVFITDEGVVKLLDFGIARLMQGSRGSSDAVMGTTDYMSPEQVLGGEVDGRSDLFGCGALLFELLTGGPPFHADSFVTIAYRVVHEEPDYTLLPASCRTLEPVLRKALAKDREQRFPSATDFATDIGLAMGVGVAPETIQPAPAWTIPLPRLTPARGTPTSGQRRPWEETAMGTPDHSPVRPRWPLHPHEDDDHAHGPKRAPRRVARTAWAALGATGALAALALGLALWRGAAPAVPVTAPFTAAAAPAAPPEPALAIEVLAPTSPAPAVDTAEAAPAEEIALATPPPDEAAIESPPTPFPRPVVVVSRAPFWTMPAPAATQTPAPASGGVQAAALGAVPPAPASPTPIPATPLPSRILSGRWTGFVTDSFCREKGAVNDHGQCLETCLRRGGQPLISVDGQIYRLVNFDRISGLHDRRVVVEGQLDLDRRVLIVASGRPAR
jgi:serine/threonine-protein kinase